MTRLLGIDLGARRIGVALADTASGHVRPLLMLRRQTMERDIETITRLVLEQRADALVVGLPRNMDGSEGPQAISTREWALAVSAALGLPLTLRDERLTSERAAVRSRRPRRGRSGGPPSAAARASCRAAIDREAAALILQSELDALDDERPRPEEELSSP